MRNYIVTSILFIFSTSLLAAESSNDETLQELCRSFGITTKMMYQFKSTNQPKLAEAMVITLQGVSEDLGLPTNFPQQVVFPFFEASMENLPLPLATSFYIEACTQNTVNIQFAKQVSKLAKEKCVDTFAIENRGRCVYQFTESFVNYHRSKTN